ncbi:DUF3224 domain-containing protein [soil metagenome]
MMPKAKTAASIIGLLLSFCTIASSQTKKPARIQGKGPETMKTVAKGTFEVKMTPLTAEENVGDATIGRLGMSKTYSGDLAGTAKGQMLGSQSEAVPGSGGYVAMERVTGTLNGKKGSFTLQHIGTMQGGKFDLNVAVVPDSGTGELTGIAGKLKIIIDGDKHLYEFEYSMPGAK